MERLIFDTHSHYTDDAFDNDRKEILDSLPEKGVALAMLASVDIDDSKANIELSEKYDWLYASVGIHPENLENTPKYAIEQLERLTKNKKVKAIGEIGLDYHYDGYDSERQIEIFKQQLDLANQLHLPVIVHIRDAIEDSMKCLKEFKPKGIVHCFSGSAETAKEVIKLGMYIGFTGVLTFKNAKKAVKALSEVPLDKLLMETDCPYMAPVPYRGKRCDSSMIPYIAEVAGQIKGCTTEEILRQTLENGKQVYNI